MKSLKFDTFEITPREMIACIAIISLFLMVGFGISSFASNKTAEENERYYTATKIEDSPDKFQYGMKTSIGNAMVYGTISTLDPVSLGEIKGDYFAINKITERYTQHTRQVPYRVGKVTHYRTEIYYTWDNINSEATHANKVKFVDTPCDANKFGFSNWENLRLTKDNVNEGFKKKLSDGYIYPSTDFFASVGDLRYSFQIIPKEFTGTALMDLRDNSFTLSHAFYYGDKPSVIIEEMEKSQRAIKITCWTVWTVVMGVTCFAFVYARNRWLED